VNISWGLLGAHAFGVAVGAIAPRTSGGLIEATAASAVGVSAQVPA
jgi:hypothetical protein